ncbi:PTS sugar transporter subunit IIA [Oceanobacillus sp. 1P07AA]|uniref:PTS sugar transporter subunit IIA n=1 Tax=Oceanobacillus sp. 1P07AA TaxID=3132293 RepID=UPI0039A4B0E9
MSELHFEEDVILLDLDAEKNDEVLKKMGQNLVDLGYVKESFIPAIIEREEEFATGLPTISVSVAIPHTDAKHVNTKTISVGVLKSPVDFVIMGEDSETTPVQIVFMLAMDEPHSQLSLLQDLMKLFQDESFLQQLVVESDASSVKQLITNKLNLYSFKGGES